MRRILIANVVLCLATLFPSASFAGEEEAIFQAAKFFYDSGQEKEGDEQLSAFLTARKLLDDVVIKYPTSDLAIRILLREVIDGVDVAKLDQTLSENSSTDEILRLKGSIEKEAEAARTPAKALESTLRQTTGDFRSDAKGGSGIADPLANTTRAERLEIQRRLQLLGYDPRGVDGIFGPGTRSAIVAWQKAAGRPPSGELTVTELRSLRLESSSQFNEWLAAQAAAERSSRAKVTTQSIPRGWYRNEAGNYCKKGSFFVWCQQAKPRGQ